MPDWHIWKHVSTAKLWECVALSLDIEPRKVRHHPQAWMTGGPGRPPVPVFCEAQSFNNRWFLARRELGTTLAGPVNPVESARGVDPVVNLATFVKWARSVDWEMPPELLELASDEQSGEAGRAPDTAIAPTILLDRSAAPPQAEGTVMSLRTGLPGKPTSWYLIEAECRRRSAAGEQHDTKAEWARVLRAWIVSQHPGMPPPTEKTIANRLTELLRELRSSPKS